MRYNIGFFEETKADLQAGLPMHMQKTVLQQIEVQLRYQPLVQTTNRKPLRPDPHSTKVFWELRIAEARIFYELSKDGTTVYIVAIGVKDGNEVRIRREKINSTVIVPWLLENRSA